MSETNHYSSQLTGQQIDEALMAARNIRNNSGVPVSSGTGLLSFRNLDTTLDGKSGGIPTSPAVMQAIKNTQSTFLNFRGSVPTVDDLPADPQKGDTYKVAADGHFYAWNGSGWDDIGTGAVAPTMAADIPTDDNRNVQEVLNQHQTELEQHQTALDGKVNAPEQAGANGQVLTLENGNPVWADSKGGSDMISDAYDSGKTYNPGDYCIYNNSLLRCLIACNGVTPTDGDAHWNRVRVADELVKVIQNENGIAKLWPNGYMECIRTVYKTLACTTAWGNFYVGEDKTVYSFAMPFVETPDVDVITRAASWHSFWPGFYSAPTLDVNGYGGYAICRATTDSSVPVSTTITARGRWK